MLLTEDILQPGHIVWEQWKVTKKIGKGGFGEVYQGMDLVTKELVALKVESSKAKKCFIHVEVDVLRKLQGHSSKNICHFIGHGRTDQINYIVMQLQGKDIDQLRREQQQQSFSLSTTLRLGYQMLKAIKAIHDVGFLHRDIKPSNFALGRTMQNRRQIFMLDFGLARQYLNANGEVRPPRSPVGFRGTTKYASTHVHQGQEASRRDDLWSFFYMLVEFTNRKILPWRKISNRDQVGNMKEAYDHQLLLKHLPLEFKQFLEHLQSLNYADKPDYTMLRGLFKRAMKRRGIRHVDPFDWEKKIDNLASNAKNTNGDGESDIANKVSEFGRDEYETMIEDIGKMTVQ